MMNPAVILLVATLVSVPTRSGQISIAVPDGWRTLSASEIEALTPKVQPQTKLHERLVQGSSAPSALLVAKHDTDGTIAASMQVFCNPIPEKMRYATSIELARVIAATSVAAYRAEYELEPRETTVSALPAAEWVARYTLVESAGGSHAMKTHGVIVAVGDNFYLIGYSGPADDTIDLQAFNAAVGSIRIQKTRR